jgi:hypothetical protein
MTPVVEREIARNTANKRTREFKQLDFTRAFFLLVVFDLSLVTFRDP